MTTAIFIGFLPSVAAGILLGYLSAVADRRECRTTTAATLAVVVPALFVFVGMGAWLQWWVPSLFSEGSAPRILATATVMVLGVISLFTPVATVVFGILFGNRVRWDE